MKFKGNPNYLMIGIVIMFLILLAIAKCTGY
jgi:hypothetical protein